tara:strand:+ start:205 stop:1119 length:915 start_codon:yes stop_codon:yes gene_type:complete
MLEIFVLAGMANGIFWYMAEVDLWYLSVLIAILSLAKYDYDTYVTSDDLKEGLNDMVKTKCCLNYFQDPKSIKTFTLTLRSITGLLAAAALGITYISKDNIAEQIELVSTCWTVVCIFWFLAIVPLFVSLLQCAAAKSTPPILRYRRKTSVYILHDLFLGGFWIYLSTMLHDLVDDVDDTEWRKIFLSMLWWHLIVLVCLAVHRIPKKPKITTCCGFNTITFWQEFFLLFSIFCIYLVIIYRLRFDPLPNMGMSVSSLFVFEFSLIIIYLCKKDPIFRPKEKIENSMDIDQTNYFGKTNTMLSF